MTPANNWIRRPTKTQLILSIVTWFAGVACLLLSLSNFCTETVIRGKFLMAGFMVLSATVWVIVICRNYVKNRTHATIQ